MSLLIKSGTVITADKSFRADVFCEKEQITRIGPDLQAPPAAVTDGVEI